MKSSAYPSVIGNKVAMRCKLYTEEENHQSAEEPMIVREMREFEELAVTGTFEDAMMAFTGRRLNARQKKELKVLYDSATARFHSKAVSSLLTIMNGADKKEAVNAAKIALTEILPEGIKKHEESSRWVVNVYPSEKTDAN